MKINMGTITICKDCGEEVETKGWSTEHDWEMWTYCPNCEIVEPETEEVNEEQ